MKRLSAPAIAVFLLLASASTRLEAQGCSQCLDQTRATPPSVQAGYRHAIELMAGAGVALFAAGVWLLRREP